MHHFCLISVPYFHLFPAAMVSRASGDPGGHRSTLTKEGSIHVPSVPGRRALLTAPPPLRSTPAPAGHNNPRRSPPAPPATDTQSSPSRRCRTGRGPPAPGRTPGGRAPPGATAPSPAVLPYRDSRSRGISPRLRATPMTSAAGRRCGRAHPSPPGERCSRGGLPGESFALLHSFAHLYTHFYTPKDFWMEVNL